MEQQILHSTVGAAVPLLNWLQKKRELDVESQRAQDETLQRYFDQMSMLVLDEQKPLRESKEGDEVRTVARARTLTLLARLDGNLNARAVQFLYEAQLIQRGSAVLSLSEADLSGINLSHTFLLYAHLFNADLSGAYLDQAYLPGAYGITNEELEQQAASLEGATMPNGQKYEEWLKDK